MRETADVVVIGGGVTGASIAFQLAGAGVRDVVVLDSGRLGSGSTARAMGGVRAGRSHTFPEASSLGPAWLRDGTLLTEPTVF